MHDYVKALSTIIFVIFTIGDTKAPPWNNNTREHLFGTVDANNQAHVSIQDEGFRWRNSFNFSINDRPISPEKWWFSPIANVAEAANNNLVKQDVSCNGNTLSSNSIHSHLAKIADKVKQINGCASVTTAAVTIVIENSEGCYAFSKMLCNDSNQIIATRTLTNNGNSNEIVSYPDFTATDIRNTIEETPPVIDSNIPNRYSCSEGQMVAKIKSNNFELVKRVINELLTESRGHCGSTINYSNIKLVVLHIGTTMDPCAICTRCIVGLSKYVNENIDNFLRSADQRTSDGTLNNSKFLVEVSSNGHYATARQYGRTMDKQDNFAAFGCGNCSHTECAGHDGGEANPINVSLNFPSIVGLAVPYGTTQNWMLSKTFPPYVVFGRINAVARTVVPAPRYDQSDGGCANRAGNRHLRHMCTNVLPIIQ